MKKKIPNRVVRGMVTTLIYLLLFAALVAAAIGIFLLLKLIFS